MGAAAEEHWRVERHEGVTLRQSHDAAAGVTRIDVAVPPGSGGQGWHGQVYDLRPAGWAARAGTVELSFEVRADPARVVTVVAQEADGEYRNLGFARGVEATAGWTRHRFAFELDTDRPTRVPNFVLGDRSGTVWLRDVRVRTKAPDQDQTQPAKEPSAPAAVEFIRRSHRTAGWQFQQHASARVGLTTEGDSLRASVLETGDESWHAQLFRLTGPLLRGEPYTLRFEARAEPARSAYLAVNRSGPEDFGPAGLSRSVRLEREWSTHEINFSPEAGGELRAPYLALGDVAGDVWLRNVSLVGPGDPAAEGAGLVPPPGAFAFPLPWDDAVPGTATDFSALNHRPAGVHGPVRVAGRHFVTADNGERIRFWGLNVGGPELFAADPSDYRPYAKRLAKHGFNAVRLHHLDNAWGRQAGHSLWKPGDGPLEVDPQRLRDLHAFIDACVAEGLYINVNLKVSKELGEADGMPASIRDVDTVAHQKRVDRFYPPLIKHQLDFASVLLESRNAAGVRLADHPALCAVELSNENSLVGWHYDPPGQGLATLPEPFRGELRAQWNRWLRAKYSNDDALAEAWRLPEAAAEDPAPIAETAAWRTLTHDSEVRLRQPTGSGDPDDPVRFVTENTNGTDWHAQAVLDPLRLREGAAYLLRLTASADRPRDLRMSLDQFPSEDGRSAGFAASVRLGVEPKTFELPMTVTENGPEGVRLSLQLGGVDGAVTLHEIAIRPAPAGHLPPPPQSLADGSVEFDPVLGRAMRRDWHAFLVETDRRFAARMTAHLREGIGTDAPVVDSQASWGGVTAYAREAGSDFLDAHEYWQHPAFAGRLWDPANWTQTPASFVSHLAEGGRRGLAAAAWARGHKRPYTLSEFDHPAPNPLRSDMLPVAAAFASLQDWDGLYLYAAGPFGRAAEDAGDTDRISGFFDVTADPSRFAFSGTAAAVFRGHHVPTHPQHITLRLPASPWDVATHQHAHWQRHAETADATAIAYAWSIEPHAPVASPQVEVEDRGGESAVRLRHHGPHPVLEVAADTFWAVASRGFRGRITHPSGLYEFGFPADAETPATVTVLSRDGLPLTESRRVLVGVAGDSVNAGMAWNDQRTSVGTAWGDGPVYVLPIDLDLKFPDASTRVACYPLDPTGARRPALRADSTGRVNLRGGRSVWFEIVAADGR
ncbi:MAG: hypothetical protein AAF800_01490 [Planctomycetota bacterium]